jgi:hypothetical protein
VLPHTVKATDQYALNATDQFVLATIVGHSLFVNLLPPKKIKYSPYDPNRSITFCAGAVWKNENCRLDVAFYHFHIAAPHGYRSPPNRNE